MDWDWLRLENLRKINCEFWYWTYGLFERLCVEWKDFSYGEWIRGQEIWNYIGIWKLLCFWKFGTFGDSFIVFKGFEERIKVIIFGGKSCVSSTLSFTYLSYKDCGFKNIWNPSNNTNLDSLLLVRQGNKTLKITRHGDYDLFTRKQN